MGCKVAPLLIWYGPWNFHVGRNGHVLFSKSYARSFFLNLDDNLLNKVWAQTLVASSHVGTLIFKPKMVSSGAIS